MKIMMIVGGYPPLDCGGTEVFTQTLAEGLYHYGKHQVVVVCMGQKDSVSKVGNIKVYRRKIFNIRFFPNFYPVKFINKLLHMYNPFHKKIFRELFQRERPDIIHIQMLRMFSPSVIQEAVKMKIPMVQTLHELYSLWNFNPFVRKGTHELLNSKPGWFVNCIREFQRKILSQIDSVTAPSSYALQAYEKEGYYRFSRKEVIPNAFSYNLKAVKALYVRKKTKLISQKKIKFLFVGRFVPEKGIDLLLDVFSNIKNKNIELFFMGTGPEEEKINKMLALDSRIHNVGFLNGDEKLHVFQECDVLILPSTSTSIFSETFGLVLLEAYMSGMPCIASASGGIPEVVENQKTGYLTRTGSFLELREAILYFSNPKNVLNSLPYCFKKIEKYNFSEMVSKFISVYEYTIKNYRSH